MREGIAGEVLADELVSGQQVIDKTKTPVPDLCTWQWPRRGSVRQRTRVSAICLETPTQSQKARLNGAPTFWQARFYDCNVWSARKRVEKLRTMHRNPVHRGLVTAPELWHWSSFRAYALGEAGTVKVNGWEVLKMKIRPPAA